MYYRIVKQYLTFFINCIVKLIIVYVKNKTTIKETEINTQEMETTAPASV